METLKHFIKLLPLLEPSVLAVIGEQPDWRQSLFDDLTENGTRITYERLREREGLPRIGIIGARFYCEAGPDTRRCGDSIFVFRVQGADKRPPLFCVPKDYAAAFFILKTHSNTPNADPLPPEILGTLEPAAVEEPELEEPIASSTPASRELLQVLHDAPAEMRKSWLPMAVDNRQTTASFIEAFRGIWVKFQLNRFCRLTTRQDSIIKQVLITELSPEQREGLLSRFNIEMLNAFMTGNSPEALAELLRSLASLPLPSDFRSAVWTAMVGSLSGDEVLRDLFEGAERLRLTKDTPDENVWSRAVLSVLESKPEDLLLKQLIDVSRGESYPLRYVCDWMSENAQQVKLVAGEAAIVPLEQMTDKQFEEHALDILSRELGAYGLARFLRVYRAGTGDSTRDRHWLQGITVQQPAKELGGRQVR